MSERLAEHFYDALQAARLASEFLGETPFDAYRRNLLLRPAVERQLEILGEACTRILQEAPSMKAQLPEAGFAIGLRNGASSFSPSRLTKRGLMALRRASADTPPGRLR